MNKRIFSSTVFLTLAVSSSLYAAGPMGNRVDQINSTADQIANQNQTDIATQRQQLQQYLNSYQIPRVATQGVPMVPTAPAVQQTYQAPPPQAYQQPAVVQQPVKPQPTTVQQPNITGYQQNNGNTGTTNKWNYSY